MMEGWPWLLFEIAVNIYQGVLVTYFIDHTLKKKRGMSWTSALCCIAFALCCTTYLFFDMPVTDTWMFLVPFLYALLCFEDSFGIKLLWWALLVALFNGITILCISIHSRAFSGYSDYMQNGTASRVVFMLSTNVVLTFSIYIVTHLKRKTRISIWSLIVFALINLLVEGILDILFALRSQSLLSDATLFLSSIMALSISLLSISLFSTMSRYAERVYEAKRAEDQRNMEKQRAEDLNATYASLHSMRHDLKNQLNIVRTLIESGHKAEGVQYLEKIDSRIFSVFSSGCIALDSALTLKELRMRQEKIAFNCELCPLSDIPIGDYELCSIITNLLDNAIEAIQRHESPPKEPRIDLFIRRVRSMLYIECRNPADPQTIRRQDGVYLTSKSGGNHGLGIKNVEAIVARAHGLASFTCEDRTFIVFISLPCDMG